MNDELNPKNILLGLIGTVALIAIVIFVVDNPDNYLVIITSSILDFSGSLFLKAILIVLIICFCIWMLGGFLISLNEKLKTSEVISNGFFWFLAMGCIIFTFIAVFIGCITIFEKFMGIHIGDSFLGNLLGFLIFILSGMAAFGIGALWFKSDYSPLSKFMKDL